MGKTYRSFDKFDSFESHDGNTNYRRQKNKKMKVKDEKIFHRSRKLDPLDEFQKKDEDDQEYE